VHVLIPAYGPSPFLLESLRSVLDAADDAIRVTVVDDGTPGDDVQRVAEPFGSSVEYLRLPTNRGVAGSFRACVEASVGEYTVLMGSDDVMEPWYFDEIRSLADHYDKPAMILPKVTVIDAAGLPVTPLADRVKGWLAPRGGRQLLWGEALATRLLLGDWLYFPAIAWRTDQLHQHPFRTDLHTALDLDLLMRLVFDGQGLAWSPRRSFRYRRHDSSASSVTALDGARFDEENDVYRWCAEEASTRGWRLARRAAQLHPTSRLHVHVSRLKRLQLVASGGSVRA
jgi:glycosyltransferase involved in cell wall biosynthesis